MLTRRCNLRGRAFKIAALNRFGRPLDSSEAGEWLRAVLVKVCKPPEAVVGTVMVQHKKWRTVHLVPEGFKKFLQCGRALNEELHPFENASIWLLEGVLARQCDKNGASGFTGSLRAKMSGILAKGELEPSDALLDLAAGIVVKADVGTELRLQWALQRRGYASVKVSQLMKADQQLWLLASDEGLPSLKPAADGVKPLNPVVEKLRVDPFDSEPKADTPEGVEAPFEKSEEDTLLQKLSQAVTKVALQAMAIDHTISKAAKQHIVTMDLSKEHGIAELRGANKARTEKANVLYEALWMLWISKRRALLLAEHGSFADDAVMEKIVLGVPRKPADFIQAAVQAGHPRSLAVTLNAVSEDAVVANRDWPVTDLIRARIDFLTYWMKRAQELEHAEKTLHLSMPEYLQQVLRGKRILLMGEMLERLGFEDKYLQQDVSEGFKLTGWLRETGCFPKKIRKPTMPAAAVMAMASSVNQRIVKQMAETSFSETDAKAWNETLAELERGWIFRDDAPDLGKVLLAKRLKGPKLWWTSFYDDFTVFSDARALTSAAVSAEALFDLWGVKFAKDGKKAVDFSATVKSLGLLIGLDTILEGRIRIMHTPERKAELEEALKGILEAGELTCKHSEQLRGASDKTGSIG
ncbi:unnamed protein product, partial [Effrenium voratum]